jgi:hypothetical protein
MAYDSNKAELGRKPYVDPTGEKRTSVGKMQSEQERGTGTGQRNVYPPTLQEDDSTFMGRQNKAGNHVRVGVNEEVNTHELKNSLAKMQHKSLPAVENPSGDIDRSGPRKAAGRVVGSKRTI